MKFIPFYDTERFTTLAIIETILAPTTDRHINAAEMRKRCRSLDAVDEAEKATPPAVHLLLEDADHEHLVKIMEGFDKFVVANKDLVKILDAIENAEKPPAIMMGPANDRADAAA